MSKFIPNSFQLPNAFVDEMLAQVSGSACKVYLLIVRKTRGWQKSSDYISYSQIQKVAGIKSHETIKNALNELLVLGLIRVKQGNEKTPNQYRLNDKYCSTKNVEGISKGTTEIVEASTEIVEQGTTEIVDTENNSFKTTREKTSTRTNDENQKNGEGLTLDIEQIKTRFAMAGIIPSTGNVLANSESIGQELYQFNQYYSHLYMTESQAYAKLIAWFKRIKDRGNLGQFFKTQDSVPAGAVNSFVAPLPIRGVAK